jgi:hypothetical protein
MTAAHVIRPEHCARHIAAQAQAGEPAMIPLFRGVREGLISAVWNVRGTQVEPSVLDLKRRPTVIVVGDDDYRSTGPSGWPQAARLMRWANALLLHGAAGEPEHYGLAVAAAVVRKRMLFVQTSSSRLAEWDAFAEGLCAADILALAIAPRRESAHPVRGTPTGKTTQ